MSDDANAEVGTADTMRERVDRNWTLFWVQLGANRFLLTAALAMSVFAGLMLVSAFVDPPLSAALRSTDKVETLFAAMIGAIITGTTLVITIGELVLSQGNGPLGYQRESMEEAMEFRRFTGELVEGVTPADPSTFLRRLIAASDRRAAALGRLFADHDDEATRQQVEELVDSIRGNAQAVERQVEGERFGTFGVMFATINFNYSWKIFQVERLTEEHGAEFSEAQSAAFADLKTVLVTFAPVRQYLKTLYFQWALIDLSRYLLYVAVAAVAVAAAMVTFLTSATFSGTLLGIPTVTWVVVAAFTFTVTPFLLFTAYILRILTLAKRTLAIGPFILRSSQQ